MAGMFLYCLKQTAKSIGADESNSHRRRIEEDQEFYRNWLFPRFERFYRQQGWEIGDGFAAEGTAARQAVGPVGGPLNPSEKSRKKSRRSCSPFRRNAGPRVKHVLKRLRFRRRQDQPPVDVLNPQVGTAQNSHADFCVGSSVVPCSVWKHRRIIVIPLIRKDFVDAAP